MAPKGKFIVVEGVDGSGKSTQIKLLSDWLTNKGAQLFNIHFPQHGQPSAYFVNEYLNGQFGSLKSIDAYKASLFYALDRYAAAKQLREALEDGKIIIADRYVGSNMSHQGGKIQDSDLRRAYFEWNLNLEYEILDIPVPDLNIVLSMPPQTATKLIGQKEKRAYIKSGNRDIHEADASHLTNAYTAFNELCDLYPNDFHLIDCANPKGIRTIESIQTEIRELVSKLIN